MILCSAELTARKKGGLDATRLLLLIFAIKKKGKTALVLYFIVTSRPLCGDRWRAREARSVLGEGWEYHKPSEACLTSIVWVFHVRVFNNEPRLKAVSASCWRTNNNVQHFTLFVASALRYLTQQKKKRCFAQQKRPTQAQPPPKVPQATFPTLNPNP